MKTRVSYYREALSVVLNLGMSEIANIIAILQGYFAKLFLLLLPVNLLEASR